MSEPTFTRALVATRRGQGDRPNDFSHTHEGELVYLGEVCDRDRLNPDEGCGCGRAFIGLVTAAGTTTAEVRRLNISRDHAIERFRTARGQAGWSADDASVERFSRLLDEVASLPIGTLVGRRLDEIHLRNPA